MQWKRLAAITLSAVLVTVPAYSIPVVDPAALAQRITMMVNQVSIITNQLTQIRQFSDQLTEMTDQVNHLKEKGLGAYHALTSPFTSLISTKTELIGAGMGWVSEFQGTAGQLANTYKELSDGVSVRGGWDGLLQAADTVTENDLLDIFSGFPADVGARAAENYRTQREAADRRRVLDHSLADASAGLIEALEAAQESLDKVRNQGERSDTALAQANITATATQAELTAALAQLQAYQSAREAGASYERELSRRQDLTRWADLFRQSELNHQNDLAEISALPDTGGTEVQFLIHPYYR